MGAEALITVPLALLVVSAVLAASTLLERAVLSPHALIRMAIKSPRNGVEFTEVFVTREVDRLLRERDSTGG